MKKIFLKLIALFIFNKKCKKRFIDKYINQTFKADLTKNTQLLQEVIFSLVMGQYTVHIADENISDIFSSCCTVAHNTIGGIHFHQLFSQELHKYGIGQMGKYVLIWGEGNWSPQPRMVTDAVLQHIPIIRAEDGFLRSADTWCNTTIDKKYTDGISFTFSNDVHYFDATRSSLMERLINNKNLIFSQEQLKRAKKCIQFIVDNYLTKYNHQPIYIPEIGRKGVKKVLVIDQSYGDFSISKGLANDNTFKKMLDTAICENPDADIIIKTHPDAMAAGSHRASGYYSGYQAHDNIYTLTSPINPIALLKYCDKVYVCTTQFGFEALMCGKEVHTFGMPFYAGWGLTIDAQKCDRRTNTRTLEEIFYIAYIMYSYYVNPKTGKKCEIEDAMEYLLQLRDEYFREFNVRKEI